MEKDILSWLCEWYAGNCNEDWEHSYGITIETLDNPGWEIVIDLKDTLLENKEYDYVTVQVNEKDWYGYKFENKKFNAAGDPSKLRKLLELFKKYVDEAENNSKT